MPNLNHTGPENEGPKTGRKLGKCTKSTEDYSQKALLGTGMGKRRNSMGGIGKGMRLKTYLKIKKDEC